MAKAKVKLPRAPLPRQTGGAHRTRRNEPARKRKHRGLDPDERLDYVFSRWGGALKRMDD
jgi:hypothetical protein